MHTMSWTAASKQSKERNVKAERGRKPELMSLAPFCRKWNHTEHTSASRNDVNKVSGSVIYGISAAANIVPIHPEGIRARREGATWFWGKVKTPTVMQIVICKFYAIYKPHSVKFQIKYYRIIKFELNCNFCFFLHHGMYLRWIRQNSFLLVCGCGVCGRVSSIRASRWEILVLGGVESAEISWACSFFFALLLLPFFRVFFRGKVGHFATGHGLKDRLSDEGKKDSEVETTKVSFPSWYRNNSIGKDCESKTRKLFWRFFWWTFELRGSVLWREVNFNYRCTLYFNISRKSDAKKCNCIPSDCNLSRSKLGLL